MPRTRGRRAVLLLGLCVALALGALIAVNRQTCRALWYVLQLKTGGIETKKAAASELGSCAVPLAVAPLLEAASDATLRSIVVESLVKIGRPGIPRLLEELQADRPRLHRVAALALRRIELEREARIEVESWFVANGSEEEKVQAFQAFAELGALPDPVIDLLTRKLASTSDRTAGFPYLVDALGRQGPRAAGALPVLIGGLDGRHPANRQRAILCMGEMAALPLAKELSNAEGHRRRVAEALSGLGPLARAAVPALTSALKDPEPIIRATVATALGAIGPEARGAIAALIERFDDANEVVRDRAASALSDLGDESVPALLKLLESGDDHQRRLVLYALEGMGGEAVRAGPALRASLDDEDLEVRTRAAVILFGLGERPDGHLPLLFEALVSTDFQVHRRAYAALDALGPRAMPLAPRLTALLREDSHLAWVLPILERLSQSSEAVLNALEQVLEENPYDVGLAAVVLKVRGTPRNVDRFVRYLSSPQRAVQVMALERIGDKGLAVAEIANQVASILDRPEVMESAGKDSWSGDDLFPPTMKAIEGLGQEAAPAARRLKEIKATGSPSARLWAARVLYRIEGRAAGVLPLALELLGKREAWIDAIRLAGSLGPAAREAEASLRAALKIPSSTIRPAAACALWRITGNHVEALAVLLAGLERPLMGFQEEPDWLLLQFGEDREPDDQILAEMGRPALEALLPLLRHTLSEVRIAACYAIGSMGRQALPGVPALCDSLRDPHLRVAGAASKSIEKLRPEDLLPLEGLLRDGDARVALRAASLLAKLRGEEAIPNLQGLLDRDDTRAEADFLIGTIDPSRRGRAQVLRNRMPPETVETLLSRLSDRDPLVARRAAEALGKLGPRAAPAVPLLTQALDREPASLEHIRALGRIRSNAPQAVPALLRVLMGTADSTSSQHRVAEEALLALGSEAVPYVIDELRDAQQKSRRSKLPISWFRVLESCGPDAAPAIPLLIAELGREYYWYRELAAKALGAIGPPAREAVPHLERILEDPKEFTSVLDAAWRALRRIRPAH